MNRKLGYIPSPPHHVGLGPLSGIQLTAGPRPSEKLIIVPPALDQLFEDCVANAVMAVEQREMAKVLGNPEGPWPELGSRAATYALARLRAYQPLNIDDGTYIHSAFEALAAIGFLPESRWSYGPEHLEVEPDWEVIRESADQRTVGGPLRIVSEGTLRVEDVLNAIAGDALVVWGTALDSAFMNLQGTDVWPGVTGAIRGGHAMYLHGYLNGGDRLSSRSSWSSDFADNGSGWVAAEAIASDNASDFWIVDAAPTFSGTT